MTTEREFSEAEDKKAEEAYQNRKNSRRGFFVLVAFVIGFI